MDCGPKLIGSNIYQGEVGVRVEKGVVVCCPVS